MNQSQAPRPYPATEPSTTGITRTGESTVLHERARQFEAQGAGHLSVKTFFGGRAVYQAGGATRAVDDGHYLLLNHGQPYAISIDSDMPVESFCIFFGPALAADVARSLSAPAEALLDAPGAAGNTPVVYDRTYPRDDCLWPALLAFRSALPAYRDRPGWLEEQLHALLGRLLEAQGRAQREVDTLPGARRATREELYRRLHIARDYLTAYCHTPLTLDDMARAACLSPNYLLRTFRQAFGLTPHQYLVGLRLAQARRLLASSDMRVTAICAAVGFASLGSFSWLFKQRHGLSPTAYRQQTR